MPAGALTNTCSICGKDASADSPHTLESVRTRRKPVLEDDRLDVRQVHDRIDDGELQFGESLATFSMPVAWAKPRADDLRARPRHVAQRLLALGLVGHLELAIRDARFLLEALGAVEQPSLKDLSNLPPMSNTMAGLLSAAKAVAANMASAIRTKKVRLSILISLLSFRRSNHNPDRLRSPLFRPDQITQPPHGQAPGLKRGNSFHI